MTYKLGSLFDGSGGFPLAGSLCGIEPVWASEVEPYPVAVTRSRFPNMKHLGSVTDVHGGEVEPVDIITFGSPCQDLSVAGKRAGLKHEANGDDETTRSGLFMEAVRIIKEMRKATNGEYPTFAVWENVPGAFSSNKGEDFRTVLEELIKIVEPTAVMPAVPKNGWPYADSYCGDGWSLAYRVFDAQYWGVPQRRRRIYLVLNLGGQRAGKVSFEREGVRGNFAESGTPWKAVAGDAADRAGAADRVKCYGIDGYNSSMDEVAATLGVNCGMSTGRNGVLVLNNHIGNRMAGTDAENRAGADDCKGIGINGEVAATLDASYYKGCGMRQGIEREVVVQPIAYTLKIRSGCEGGGKGALIQEDKSATLATNNDQYLFQPCVLEAAGFKAGQSMAGGIGWQEECEATLAAQCSGTEPTVCVKKAYSIENHPADSRVDIDDSGKVQTLTSRMGTGGGNVPMVLEAHPVYCLQGNGIDRADTAGCNGKGWKEGTSYTLNTIDRPAVAFAMQAFGDYKDCGVCSGLKARDYKDATDLVVESAGIDCRSFTEYPELYPTLQAKPNGGQSLNFSGDVRVQYIVRRLTPTECARLQGFQDDWGHPDHKEDFADEEYRFWLNVRNTHAAINGKPQKDYTKAQMLTWYNRLHTDSSEYKMWGNGISLPTALYVIQGIAEVLKGVSDEKENT